MPTIARPNFTFHSGYILIERRSAWWWPCINLYIPFWLYSNNKQKRSLGSFFNFTFHSGYILIKLPEVDYSDITHFTFHSGYILIEFNQSEMNNSCFFTFHSGYILMAMKIIDRINLMLFTFHSGYILMNGQTAKNYFATNLYIPFWLYSN